MPLWNPNESRPPENLSDLGLNEPLVHRCLFAAETDAQLNSTFDSPTAFGFTLWTRANRYLREELVPEGWTIRNSKLIMRVIHPSKLFAITATSADGAVGDVASYVKAKNPKGAATRRIVNNNGTIPLMYGMSEIDNSFEHVDDEIPTWFLLYKRTYEGIFTELSYPIDMTGAYVDRWHYRVPISWIDLGGRGGPWDSGPETDFPINER